MKRFVLCLLTLLLVAADRSPQQKYIDQYAQLAISEMERTGVPASITLAQGLVESRAGLSPLASKGNNHFGIKCHNDWKGRKMYADDDKAGECFRVYPTADKSFMDHSDFLRYRDRYKFLFELDKTDYKGWARGLKKAGYATDPAYANKLIKVIEEYELYRFDVKAEVIPEAPLEIEAPKKYVPPKEEHWEKPEYSEEHSFSLSRNVMTRNGVPFITAMKGETYSAIASAQGLFLKELLRYNDLKKEVRLEEGDVVFLQAKKNKAEKGLEKYIVDSDGEDLRGISQRFGVKLSAIRKLNGYDDNYVPCEGDSILLR